MQTLDLGQITLDDEWLSELLTHHLRTPDPIQLAELRQRWADLGTSTDPKYSLLIDARIAMVDAYIAANTLRRAREKLTNRA